MKRIGFENTFIVLLGTIALVASVPVRAQGPDAGIDADASTDAGGQTTVNLHPPHLLDAPPPRYPAGREELGVHPTVLLRITVGSDAQVTDVVVVLFSMTTGSPTRCSRNDSDAPSPVQA